MVEVGQHFAGFIENRSKLVLFRVNAYCAQGGDLFFQLREGPVYKRRGG